jgi:hypothetical protein
MRFVTAFCPILILAWLGAAAAHAQPGKDAGESRMKMHRPSESGEQAVQNADDIDAIITNQRMRAESGSKSKYSVSTSFGYSGGSLTRPFGEKRLNITGGTGSTDVTALSGNISGKYNMSTRSSIFAGVGVRWITPLQGTRVPGDFHGDKIDVDNPNVSYQYLYRWLGVQSSLNLNETFFTASNLVRQGFLTSWGFGQNNVYDFDGSRFSLGIYSYLGLAAYNKNDRDLLSGQSDYSWGFLPAVEYRLNDQLSLRASTNLFIYEHLRSEPRSLTLRRQEVTQSLGVGYALRRDIFLSPGVSFVASNLRWDRTIWSLGANINLF